MAGPTVPRRTTSPASKLVQWTQTIGSAFGRPLFAVLLALLLGGMVIMITASGSLADRFTSAITAYQYLYTGSFGTLQSTSYSLVKVTSLIFAGLSVAIAFRAGLFNIGAAGQLAVGTLAAGTIAFLWPDLAGGMLIPLMIIGSALAGALWGGIVGLLKALRGAHEVVTTIMLNWIAFFVAAYLIDGPLQAPHLSQQSQPLPHQATLPSIAVFYNQTLGTLLPQISTPEIYTVDVSLLFALFALLAYWFITSRMTFGYELRVLGQNLKAARYAGIPVKKNIIAVMALAGAFAGLAGSLRLMGQVPYQMFGSSFSIDSTGFDAIGVALLGRTTPIGILLAALLFGGLQQAAPTMEMFAHIPGDLIYIIQALVLFSIAAEFLPALQRSLPVWMPFSTKPALASNSSSTIAVEVARNSHAERDADPVIDENKAVAEPAVMPVGQEE